MTEGNQDETIKRSKETSEGEDKVVDIGTSGHQQDQILTPQNNQLESADGDLSQQQSNSDEGQSKKEDYSAQEPIAQEDGEAVQTVESEEPGENVENEQQTATVPESSSSNKATSEVQEIEQKENSRNGEKQQDTDEKKDVDTNEQPHSEIQAATEKQEVDKMNASRKDSEPEQQKDVHDGKNDKTASEPQQREMPATGGTPEGDATTTSDDSEQQKSSEATAGEEWQNEESAVTGEAQEDGTRTVDESKQQKDADGNIHGTASESEPGEFVQEGGASPTEKQGHSEPLQNDQQEIGDVVANQEQQSSHGQVEEAAEKPVESDNKETNEEQRNDSREGGAEECQPEQEEGIGSSANENSPDSDTQPASDKQEDGAQETAEKGDMQRPEVNQPCETAQESDAVDGKCSVEMPVETAGESQLSGETEVRGVTTAGQQKPDLIQEENRKLKQDIFMMKQQEDAYRIRVLSLEQEVGKLRARKIDNRSQDSLASDSDSYLKQKLAETEKELDAAERKVKDLQLRLKRFAKDDQIKDEKISQMEKEVKELSEHARKVEQSLAESKKEGNNNAAMQASTQKNDSKVCVII